MPTPLSCRTARQDDTVSLIAVGEIDLSNSDTFAQAVSDASSLAAHENLTLTVDLGDIEYLDSGAISTLFAHADQIRIVANPILMPVLTISGLPHVVDVRSA